MKFEEALQKAYDIEKSKNPDFKGIGEVELRAAAWSWNILAVAQDENKIVLDDIVIINKDNFRNSIPLQKKEKTQATQKKAQPNDVNVKEKTAETI